MKSIGKISFPLTVILLLLISACKHQVCYQCYYFNGTFIAVKGTDTVKVYGANTKALFQDSTNIYLSLGYRIDTTSDAYAMDRPTNPQPPCNSPEFSNSASVPPFDSCITVRE